MELSERLLHLLVGGGVGFILGYVSRLLTEIKEEVHEVDVLMKEQNDPPVKDEGGFMNMRIVRDLAVLVVVLLTTWAALVSQKASNEVVEAQEQQAHIQDQLKQITVCNQRFLADTISVLNEVTTPSRAQSAANVELQKAQAAYLRIIIGPPPPTMESAVAALKEYFAALTEFIEKSNEFKATAQANPYPTEDDFNECIREGLAKEDK